MYCWKQLKCVQCMFALIFVVIKTQLLREKDNPGEAALFALISGSFQTNLVGLGVMVIIRVVSGRDKREVIAGDILRGNCE